MFGISWTQISGIVQRVLMFGGGIAVGKGWISQELMIQLVGAAVGVLGVIWSAKENTQTSLVAKVDAMPEIAGVVTKRTEDGQALAAAVPSQTVVAAGSPGAAAVAR